MSDSEYKSRIKQAGDDAYAPFVLETGDGREFELGNENIKWYAPYSALDALYGPFRVLGDVDVIPIKIATEGNPAIATYLMFVYHVQHGISRKKAFDETASKLDVNVYTVRKYLNRVYNQVG